MQTITIRVINNGATTATNVPVFYKVDNQTKVTATVASLARVLLQICHSQ
jgi:hypothetical protein